MARRKSYAEHLKKLKRSENGGIKITSNTICNKQSYDLLSGFCGLTDELTALKSIIAECDKNGIEYTLSAYCKDLLKQGAAV